MLNNCFLEKRSAAFDPPGYTESAARLSSAVVRNKEIGVGALECNNLERLVRFDFSHKIVKLIVHAIGNGVDGGLFSTTRQLTGHGFIGN